MDYNPNNGSFLVPSKLELYYPKLKRTINRKGITIENLGAEQDSNMINLEKFAAQAKQFGIPEIHYFVRSRNGFVSKEELQQFLDTERLAAAVDNLQRRTRVFLKEENKKLRGKLVMGKNDSSKECIESIQEKELEKFDFKNYLRNSKTFLQFRNYDTDLDGYISREEFLKTLADKTDFSHKQTCALYIKFDPQATGRITFGQFASCIHLHKDKEQQSIPCTEYNSRLYQKVKAAKQRQEKLRKEQEHIPKPHLFQPDTSSRYSAWPSYLTKNTYDSTMYGRAQSEEKSRLDNTLDNKLRFQSEERKIKESRLEAAITRRQKIDEANKSRAEIEATEEYFSPEKSAELQKTKGAAKAEYELKVKLQDIGI